MAAPTPEMAALALKTAPIAAPVLPKGTKGSKITVVTNSFKVAMKANLPFFLHDFRVKAVFVTSKGEEKLKEITKQTRQDFVEQDRKRAALLTCLTMRRSGVLKGEFIYDRAALLISLQEIQQCKKGGEFLHVLTPASAPDLFALDSIREAKEIRVTIKKAAESYQVTSNDISSKDPATKRAILTVIDLATSQTIFEQFNDYVVYGNGCCYLLNPTAHGFAPVDVGTIDKYGAVGMTKGARIIDTPNGQAAAITVDMKKTAIHVGNQKISDKLRMMTGAHSADVATSKLAGIECTVNYEGARDQKARRITIGSVSSRRVKDVIIANEKTGKKQTLPEFIFSKYNTRITDPNAPAIIDKHEGNYYAPECLKTCPGQRMKKENNDPISTERLIRESAVVPSRRLGETKTLTNLLDVAASNDAQAKRGITVNTAEPIKVEGRVLTPVVLGTGAGPITVVPKTGKWTQGQYAQHPSDYFKRWTVLHLRSSAQEPEHLTTTVVNALQTAMMNGGFDLKERIKERKLCEFVANSEQEQERQLTSIFEAEKAAGSQFVMIITSHNVKNHGLIKFLELKMSVVTQQITAKTAMNIGHQPNTASNIAIKMLEKMGGQNVYIAMNPDLPKWLTLKGSMICSVQMDMPSSLTGKQKEQGAMPSRPVMIGYSSDAVRGAKERGASDKQLEMETTHFSSSWTYAMPKDYQGGSEFTASYKEVVLSILRAYKKYRDSIPSRIILIRGGLAAGDFEKIRSEEVPIWLEAFKTLNAAYNPTFIILTASDTHVDRLFNSVLKATDKAPQQSLPSGTVVDSGITTPGRSQAWIQAHQPLQGTAKVPLYSLEHVHVLPSQKISIDMDEIIRIIHSLCFAHGVCNTPTALPAPLMNAKRSAKRATDQFDQWQRSNRDKQWTIETLINERTIKEDSDIHGYHVNA